MKHFLLAVFLSTATGFCNQLIAQCNPAPAINVINPSFEGTPQEHVTPAPWSICMSGQTPDTQPGFWGVNVPASNGNSYLGLIHQASSNWQEGACQQLSSPFIAGTQYAFTMDLANSSSVTGGIIPGCAECVIYGGFGACDQNTVLWRSGDITPYDTWMTQNVVFTPTQNFTWILIQVLSLGCTDGPYILVDNISPILPANVTASFQLINNVSCAGGTNGLAVLRAVGNNPPFVYNWSTSSVIGDTLLSNVPSGTYSVTVTDANTCTSTASINITQPQATLLTPTLIQPNCEGFNTGSAYMSYAGGSAPYTFLWSNGVTTQNNSNLFAGTYGITATDANNCTTAASIILTDPSGLGITPIINNAICGNNNGSVTAAITNGTGPFTYLWSNGQTTQTISNLAAGTYLLTVTEAGQCIGTASATVNSSSGINLAFLVTNENCGSGNGAVTASASGGNGSFTYSWSTGGTFPGINNLAAGTYFITVSSNGCSQVDSVTVGISGNLGLTTNAVDAGCSSTGSASVNVTVGSGPYIYSWSNGGSTSTITGLSAGSYQVTVTGANNCSSTAGVTVNASGNGVTLVPNSTNTSCGNNNGSATINITSGAAPFVYVWSNGGSTNTISNLSGGTYTVTVTGAGNCTATASFNVASSSGVVLNVTSTSTNCGNNNGTATVAASGGSGVYDILWSNGSNLTSLANLSPGTYTVTVNDNQNCSATASVTVNPSGQGSVNITTDKDLMCSGDSAQVCAPTGYSSYLWNTGQTGRCITTQLAGNYYVTVTDAGNCTASSNRITINVYPLPPVSITVNGDTLTAFNAVTYQWYLNDAAIPGATAPVYIAPQAGNYSVAVTDSNGCRAVSTKITIVKTGIDELIEAASVTVYPNPLQSGNWVVETGVGMIGARLEIFDDNGRIVYRSEIREMKSEIPFEAASGVYLLRISSNRMLVTRKLIKF